MLPPSGYLVCTSGAYFQSRATFTVLPKVQAPDAPIISTCTPPSGYDPSSLACRRCMYSGRSWVGPTVRPHDIGEGYRSQPTPSWAKNLPRLPLKPQPPPAHSPVPPPTDPEPRSSASASHQDVMFPSPSSASYCSNPSQGPYSISALSAVSPHDTPTPSSAPQTPHDPSCSACDDTSSPSHLQSRTRRPLARNRRRSASFFPSSDLGQWSVWLQRRRSFGCIWAIWGRG